MVMIISVVANESPNNVCHLSIASSIKMLMVLSLDPATADFGVTRMFFGLELNKTGISPAKNIYII